MQNTKVVRVTRTSKPKTVYSKVAIWHFDKKLLGSLDEGFTFVPKMMDTKLATSKRLYHASGSSIYSQADSIELKGVKQVLLVPTSYNVTTIMKDLKDATVESEEVAIVQTALKEAETRNKTSSTDRSWGHHVETSVTVSPSSSSDASDKRDSQGKQKKHKGPDASDKHDSQGKKKKHKGPDIEVIPRTAFFEMSTDEQIVYFDKLRADVLTFKQSSAEKLEEKDVQLGDLLNAKHVIADALKREEEIAKKTKGIIDQLKRKQASMMELEEHLKALKEVAGLNRISIASKNGSVANDASVCKKLFGFDDFDFMIDFLESAFEIQYVEPTKSTISAGGTDGGNGLGDVEQVLLTLVFTNTLWNCDVIAMMFGVSSTTTVSNCINRWLPLLGECGDHMSDFLAYMDEDAFEKLEPESYK